MRVAGQFVGHLWRLAPIPIGVWALNHSQWELAALMFAWVIERERRA